jgi:hypothetical protein
MYEEVKNKLINFPEFRERKFRNKFLVVLAMRKTGFKQDAKMTDGYINYELKCHDDFADFAIRFDSYRHTWGEVTRKEKELRGTDWEDGEILSQQKQLELGYMPSYESDIKKLENLN